MFVWLVGKEDSGIQDMGAKGVGLKLHLLGSFGFGFGLGGLCM